MVRWEEIQRQAKELGHEMTDAEAREWADKVNESKESDPTGRDAHTMGAKLDAGKPRMSLVLGGFARALTEVAKVGTFGAAKYADGSWVEVPNGIERYRDAGLRHEMAAAKGELNDPDSQLLHMAHKAWNALAELDLYLREQEKKNA